MLRFGSTLVSGARRAVAVDGESAWISTSEDLDQAVANDCETLLTRREAPVDVRTVRFDAPLRPPVVFCAGQNYRDHLAEKAQADAGFEFFLKAGQTISRPDEPVILDPRVTAKLDYETELGVVIGRECRHVSADAALECVAGYVVLNDLTARDRQVVRRSDGSMAMALGPGKNFDGSTRMGSSMVRRRDVADPQRLGVRTWVDGELRQDNTTANMIWSVAEIVAWMSTLLTLRPGLVIATGTPGGTGWGTDRELGGTARTPPGCVPASYLRPGQHVRGEIESVGEYDFEVRAADGIS